MKSCKNNYFDENIMTKLIIESKFMSNGHVWISKIKKRT